MENELLEHAVVRTYERIVAHLVRNGLNFHDAQEITQDTWAIATIKWSTWEYINDRATDSLIFTIATRLASRHAQYQGRFVLGLDDDALEAATRRQRCRVSFDEAAVCDKLDLDLAKRALSPQQQAVLRLAYDEDCTLVEAAKRLGISHPAAKTHHQRGLGRLKRSLGG